MTGTLLAALLTAHLVVDFVLQSDADVERKDRPAVLLKHIALVTAVTYIVVADGWRWDIALLAGLGHALVDYVKTAWTSGRGSLVFTLDQAAHLVMLAALAVLVTETGSVSPVWVGLIPIAHYRALLVVTSGAVACVWAGGVIVGFIVEPFRERMDETVRRGFERGGRTIGRLERGLIFLLVTTGHMTAVGFLVAAKSVFRFGDLSSQAERATAEYILIGTLASFLWAAVVSLATLSAMSVG